MLPRAQRINSRSATAMILAAISALLFGAGFVFIGFFVWSASAGPHLRFLGAGFLTACAAFAVGALVGLIVGIPRFVSSGAMRQDVEARRQRAVAVQAVSAAASAGRAGAHPGTAHAGGHPAPGQPNAQPGQPGQPGAQPGQPGGQGGGQGGAGQAGQPGQPAQGGQAALGGQGGQAAQGGDARVDQGIGVLVARAPAAGAGQGAGAGQNAVAGPRAGQVAEADQGGGQDAGAPQVAAIHQAPPSSQFTPSTNLAEISDWLTKLLLGAGLVELTRLGHPLSALIDSVARSMQDVAPGAKLAQGSTVVAGGILALYVVLGFLDSYIITTLWYGKYLEQFD